MRIALIGYGKMGKTIEQIALQRGHVISYIIDRENAHELSLLLPTNTDVAIEFTSPERAFGHVQTCLLQGIPIVCGTTGWLKDKQQAEQLCLEMQGAFFYASNFSIGVNIFFRLNEYLATLMAQQPSYQASMEEIHHTEKKDAPSGTAITLAEGVIKHLRNLQLWVNEPAGKSNELSIISKREPEVAGTHSIFYNTAIDEIEIKHTAHSRNGFATGAVLAAEWIQGRRGVLGMADMLGF